MKKERKALAKKFKVVVEDLLDNYEKYSEEEKAQIKEIFEQVAKLNKVLDKYDFESDDDWVSYIDAYHDYFDMMRY